MKTTMIVMIALALFMVTGCSQEEATVLSPRDGIVSIPHVPPGALIIKFWPDGDWDNHPLNGYIPMLNDGSTEDAWELVQDDFDGIYKNCTIANCCNTDCGTGGRSTNGFTMEDPSLPSGREVLYVSINMLVHRQCEDLTYGCDGPPTGGSDEIDFELVVFQNNPNDSEDFPVPPGPFCITMDPNYSFYPNTSPPESNFEQVTFTALKSPWTNEEWTDTEIDRLRIVLGITANPESGWHAGSYIRVVKVWGEVVYLNAE